MDQLKPLLEHKFWIIAAAAILLAPIGWWMATGEIAASTEKRRTDIDKNTKAVDKLKSDVKKMANNDWIGGAVQANVDLDQLIGKSQENLYKHQRTAMVWPPIVQRWLNESGVKYRQDGVGNSKFRDAQNLFLTRYGDDFRSVINIIEPYNFTTGEGKVVLVPDARGGDPVFYRYPVESWQQSMLFSSAQMWDAQEDLWLLRECMRAVARTNTGTTDIGEARVKQLIEIKLRGGSLADLDERRTGKQQNQNQPQGQPQNQNFSADLSLTGMRSGRGVMAAYQQPKKFDADDVFGSDGSSNTATPAATNPKHGDKTAEPAAVARYLATAPGKWRSRAFVLRVVMDQRHIPTLVAELSKSNFPVDVAFIEHGTFSAQEELGKIKSELTQQSSVAAARAAAATDKTGEQAAKEREERIENGLNLAFGQNYLSDVTIAGTFTIYDEPASADKGPSASPAAASPAAADGAAAARTSLPTSPPAFGGKPPGAAANAAPTAKGPAASLPLPAAASASKAAGPAPAPSTAGIAGPAAPKGLPGVKSSGK